ncbi:hypothetical protein IMCC9480_1922 [Oxalobacteraceae bacterium IMCC9480]|nr:hypothetical protein IMCC9480_1922 [Oxalobacteraceae bacterium IMCC9480]
MFFLDDQMMPANFCSGMIACADRACCLMIQSPSKYRKPVR